MVTEKRLCPTPWYSSAAACRENPVVPAGSQPLAEGSHAPPGMPPTFQKPGQAAKRTGRAAGREPALPSDPSVTQDKSPEDLGQGKDTDLIRAEH